jgi:hypothetical protein
MKEFLIFMNIVLIVWCLWWTVKSIKRYADACHEYQIKRTVARKRAMLAVIRDGGPLVWLLVLGLHAFVFVCNTVRSFKEKKV